jgi:endo-1,4-beta-xylanase
MSFVPVIGIIQDFPMTVLVGTEVTLDGSVMPSDATNQTIQWSLESGGGSLSGNRLLVTTEGDVVVAATIKNGIEA